MIMCYTALVCVKPLKKHLGSAYTASKLIHNEYANRS
jgi:hypothetical protein